MMGEFGLWNRETRFQDFHGDFFFFEGSYFLRVLRIRTRRKVLQQDKSKYILNHDIFILLFLRMSLLIVKWYVSLIYFKLHLCNHTELLNKHGFQKIILIKNNNNLRKNSKKYLN